MSLYALTTLHIHRQVTCFYSLLFTGHRVIYNILSSIHDISYSNYCVLSCKSSWRDYVSDKIAIQVLYKCSLNGIDNAGLAKIAVNSSLKCHAAKI